MDRFPPIVVIAQTEKVAGDYCASNNFIGFGRQPILASPESACWKLIGARNYLVILVNLRSIAPEHMYRLERNVVIRTTF